MRLPALFLLAALVASPAAAQGIALEIDPFGPPLAVLGGHRAVAGNVTAPCLLSPQGAPVGVRLSVSGPAVGSAKAAPEVVAPPEGCNGSFTSNFTVLVAFDAPALALHPYVFTVHAAASNATVNATANTSITAIPAFYSILDAQVRETVLLVAPQEVATYQVTLINFGNGVTKVSFEVTQKPPGFNIATPNPVTLEPAGNATIPVAVQAPFRNGYTNEVGATTIRLTSVFALDPRLKGDETELSFLTTARGWYLPATAGVAVVALLAAVALALRRQR